RSGFADAARELPGILRAVREAQPDFVMLHFRTVQEEYQAVPGGWERLARAKELLGTDLPLLGAGDVVSVDTAAELWRQTGVDGVTPARGLLRNPWLLREIAVACGGAGAGKRPSPDGRRGVAESASGTGAVTLADRVAFLRELVAVSAATGEWRAGFVLELARNLFGVETELFRKLARSRCAREMLAVLA
ncbi:MAG: tRNA-dihydrouridine synthase, partial [bacterium]